MRAWTTVVYTLLIGVALTGLAARVQAANITNLADSYFGAAHGLTLPALEDTNLSLDFENRQPNGKFEARFGVGDPVPGKVTPKGKLTFGGTIVDSKSKTDIKVKAAGQLSVGGRFITGTLSLKGLSGGNPIDEKFTFDIEREDDSKKTGARGCLLSR